MTISRRSFLCGCGGTFLLAGLAGGRAATAASASLGTGGCIFAASAGASNLPGCGALSTTGSADLDAAFGGEFAQQRDFFSLPDVTLQFLDDCDGPNAFAIVSPPTIWYGVGLARDLYTQYVTTLPLWQVLAHEFGHHMQNTYGHAYLGRSTAVLTELEADMFSGFYLGYAKNANAVNEIQTILPLAFSKGDYLFNNPTHHGTPDQRVAAVFHGVVVAYEFLSGAIEPTVQAIRARFARSLPT